MLKYVKKIIHHLVVEFGTNIEENLISDKNYLPKLIPHNPVKTVKRLTQNISP